MRTVFMCVLVAFSSVSLAADADSTGSFAAPTISAPTTAVAGSVVPVSVSGTGLAVTVVDDQGNVLYDSDTDGTTGQNTIDLSFIAPNTSAVFITATDVNGGTSTATVSVV